MFCGTYMFIGKVFMKGCSQRHRKSSATTISDIAEVNDPLESCKLMTTKVKTKEKLRLRSNFSESPLKERRTEGAN